MELSLDQSITRPRDITSESLALAKWYDAHPGVQRLWGISDTQALRVVVLIEPTYDGDDVYPPLPRQLPDMDCESFTC
jgi:hypothetical protein